MTSLIRYEAARTALAEAHRVDEVKDIRDKAEAMVAYARQAKDQDLILWATEIKVRAERRAGEMLSSMEKSTGSKFNGRGPDGEVRRSHDDTATLADIGISKIQSSRWQSLASMSDEHFETAVATAKDTAGQAAVARLLAVIYNTARTGLTSQYLIPFVEGTRVAYSQLIDFCPKHQKLWSSAPIRAAAILRILMGGDKDYICLAYYSLVHMDFETMSPVIQTLFKQMTAQSGKASQVDLFCRAYKAFDVRNAGMTAIVVSDTARITTQARDVISHRVLGMKKAPDITGAKKVSGSNSTFKARA